MKDHALKIALEKSGDHTKLNSLREYLQAYLLKILHEQGFFRHAAFLGGTALRFLYDLPRFSEDLDFTVINSEHQNESFLINAFKEVADWIYEAAGIEIPKETIRFEVYTNPRGKISVQGRISYRGPLQP